MFYFFQYCLIAGVICSAYFLFNYKKIILEVPNLAFFKKNYIFFLVLLLGFIAIPLLLTMKICRIFGLTKSMVVDEDKINQISDFNHSGLKFDNSELEDIFPEIIFKPIEEQAQYVDSICFASVNEHWFTESILEAKQLTSEEISFLNATSIGNLAYVILNCKNEEVVERCKKQMEVIKEKFKNN